MKLTQTLPTKGIPVNAHFLDLVKQGQRPGCSTTERGARLLATAVLDHALGLDNEATRGLVEWLTWSRQFPTTARDYLEQ